MFLSHTCLTRMKLSKQHLVSLPPPSFEIPKVLVKECEQKLQLNFPLEPEFVRALKDSKMNTKPYFRKGHILRVIKKARRGKLAGELKGFGVGGQMLNFI